MMKVLWIGDAITQSGFSIVTHNICNELRKKCEVVVYGIRYDGSVKNPYPYHIYPGQTPGGIYNFDRVGKIVKAEEPDVTIIFNDSFIVRRFLDTIPPGMTQIVLLFPVNLLPIEKTNLLAFSEPKFGVSEVMSYTEFSKQKINEINPNLNVTAIYHGVNRNVFYPIKDAKAKLGLDGYFIVGNINANTTRKRLDLFLEGFAKFAKNKANVKCLIHATNQKPAYNLVKIAQDLGIADKVILSQNQLEFTDMNLLYNVLDINVNTSVGEGFGLSLIEGSSCGVPVLCPAHGNLLDIWQQGAEFIKIARQEYIPSTDHIADIISTDDFASKLDKFYNDRKFVRRKGEEALDYSKESKFSWKTVADKVLGVIYKANENKINVLFSIAV